MQRIEIKNFGPIKNVAFDIKDYTVFIGPQASGKSTIARAVYFFKEIELQSYRILMQTFAKEQSIEEMLGRWQKQIALVFHSYWDRSFLRSNTKLVFTFGANKFLAISFENGLKSAQITVSESLRHNHVRTLEVVKEQGRKFFQLHSEKSGNMSNIENMAVFYLLPTQQRARDREADESYEYIPAGRTIFFNLFNELAPGMAPISDVLVQNFIQRTNKIRRYFAVESIESRIKDNQPDNASRSNAIAEKIYRFANQILLATYRQIGGKDYLQLQSNELVPISSASSGQQEAVWILYHLLYHQITRSKDFFAAIEEPEAHLFPNAQKSMMLALTLFANDPRNQLMLTTHSPYILTPLNNLLLAHKIGQDKREAVEKVVDPDLWIDPERFECYYVDGGTIRSVMDRQTGMMDLDDLDAVSSTLNEQYDLLAELED